MEEVGESLQKLVYLSAEKGSLVTNKGEVTAERRGHKKSETPLALFLL